MFYLVGIFRTSSMGHRISSNPERTVQGGEGKSGYIEVLQQRTGIQNIKRSSLMKENHVS